MFESIMSAREFLTSTVKGEDWENDPHLDRTPERFAHMLYELTTPDNFEFTTFDNDGKVDEMIVVKDIPFYSLCAHHVIPFFGCCHVAYIPDQTVAGLSKFARAVHYFSHGLNVQEHLTTMIADFVAENLDPLGVGVVMEAEHLCMTMRGAQTPGAKTTTSKMLGVFLDPEKGARQEFLHFIGR